MEDLLKEPILEQLFKAKKEKFEYYIIKTDEEHKQIIEQVIKLQDKVDEQLEKAIGSKKTIEKVKKGLREVEIAMSAENYFWSINYYKLGFYDGINFRKLLRECKEKDNKKPDKESFLYCYMEYFMDFIEERKVAMLKEREDYKQALTEIEKIKEEYPKVRNFFEANEISEFTKEENTAILKIINLNNDVNSIEVEEVFKLGIKEGTLL